MTAGPALLITLFAALGGAFLGATVGGLLGVLAPTYYQSVFSGPVDPIPTGLGLGIAQGLILGGVVGLGIVGILTWREVKLREIESRRSSDYPRPQ